MRDWVMPAGTPDSSATVKWNTQPASPTLQKFKLILKGCGIGPGHPHRLLYVVAPPRPASITKSGILTHSQTKQKGQAAVLNVSPERS